jgi:hypothetical protein
MNQICLDNASAMLEALDELVALYPPTHILDLFLEDWGKEEIFKALITRTKRVYIYIKTTMQQWHSFAIIH